MKIKELTVQKTRTISVEGIMGREKYRKIEIRLVGDKEEKETYKQAKTKITNLVDEFIQEEVIKLKKETNKFKKIKL